MKLHHLRPAEGAVKDRRRVGRGKAAGRGKTAGRGTKGYLARHSKRLGFEGGQMPLQRRLPKRGFTNKFRKEWIEVSLGALDRSFDANEEITPDRLHERGLIKKVKRDVVVLGTGDITKALRISAHRFTKSAREKIESAGGQATIIEKQ